MTLESDLRQLTKKELIKCLMRILIDYKSQLNKLPFVYCPVCNRKLKHKGRIE